MTLSVQQFAALSVTVWAFMAFLCFCQLHLQQLLAVQNAAQRSWGLAGGCSTQHTLWTHLQTRTAEIPVPAVCNGERWLRQTCVCNIAVGLINCPPKGTTDLILLSLHRPGSAHTCYWCKSQPRLSVPCARLEPGGCKHPGSWNFQELLTMMSPLLAGWRSGRVSLGTAQWKDPILCTEVAAVAKSPEEEDCQ